jgi:hypothetical protein
MLEGPRNMKSKTYSSRPFIWYTTWLPFKNIFFALDDLAPTLSEWPKIWNPKPTRQDLSFDILHHYLSQTFKTNCTWWPCPTPSEGPQNMKSTSRNASFCRTSLRWRHTSGNVTVTSLHLPAKEVLWFQNPGFSSTVRKCQHLIRWISAYPMKVNPATRRANYIWHLYIIMM